MSSDAPIDPLEREPDESRQVHRRRILDGATAGAQIGAMLAAASGISVAEAKPPPKIDWERRNR